VDARRFSRPVSFALVGAAYALAAVAAGLTVWALDGRHPLTVALAADVVATVAVFAVSMLVDNASVYDPYWSVAPPVIAAAWVFAADDHGVASRQALIVALIGAWAIRLTANWAYGWSGLAHEDWRYTRLRTTRGGVPWWVVNLGGIQLMPTLIVFVALLPVWAAVTGDRPLSPLDAVAALVTAAAIALEATADAQMHRFRADPANRGRLNRAGLWGRLPHPNYVGEMAFWWGLWLFALAAAPSWWWTVVGPLTVTALFVGVSIPMMDRRIRGRSRGRILTDPAP
jgi:steroid 5-alpha reductase family enzyme